MSFYIDTDEDMLYKEKVELVCGLCSTRFKKFKVDINTLSYFDGALIRKDGNKGSQKGSSSCLEGDVCSGCTKCKSKLDLEDRPFKCPFCDKLFAHSLHLLKHKLRHTDQESGREVVVEEDYLERISIDPICGPNV